MSDLMDKIVSWAIEASDQAIEQAIEKFVEKHGRYPKFAWFESSMKDLTKDAPTDAYQFCVTAFASDEIPDDVPPGTAIIDLSPLNANQVYE